MSICANLMSLCAKTEVVIWNCEDSVRKNGNRSFKEMKLFIKKSITVFLYRLVTILAMLLCAAGFAEDSLTSPGNLPGPHAFLTIHSPAYDTTISD